MQSGWSQSPVEIPGLGIRALSLSTWQIWELEHQAGHGSKRQGGVQMLVWDVKTMHPDNWRAHTADVVLQRKI